MLAHRLARLYRWSTRTWRGLQVELHGQYSDTQLQRFEHYQATTSLRRVVFVCVCMPVPMVAVILALGLLRLEPVEQGAFGSPHVWFRQWLTTVLMSLCVLQQLRQHLPEFELNVVDCVLVSLLSSTCNVGSALALAAHVGYPLPFTVILGSLPWYAVFIAVFVLAMTMIYPIYSYVYANLSPLQQTAFVLLLPLLKLLSKNWICRALPDRDDAKPEAVVFNVEVFHSLFVSLCMGNTTSSRTVVVLLAVDLVEAWVAFLDVTRILCVLQPLAGKLTLPSDMRLDRYPSVALLANGLLDQTDARHATPPPALVSSSSSRPSASRYFALWWTRLTSTTNKHAGLDVKYIHASATLLHGGRIAPAPVTTAAPPQSSPADAVRPAGTGSAGPRHALISSVRASLTAAEAALLIRQTQKLLFATEFIVLIEYTEVIMPTIYNILVWAFYNSPNREFYTFFYGVCSRAALYKTLATVQLYGCLELLSLAAMAGILWKKLGLSVFHQLAFVLEHRAANILSKLLLWVVYIMQNSIVQLGSDYSFQFKWLHLKPGDAPFTWDSPCSGGTSSIGGVDSNATRVR